MAIEERQMDRTDRMVRSVEHVFDWFAKGPWERHRLDPGIADFAFGNPQEMPLPGLVDALQRARGAQGQGLVRLQVQRGRAARASSPSRSARAPGSSSAPRTSP